MKTFFYCFFFLLISNKIFAQSVTIDPQANASGIINIQSTNKGVLVPNMTTAQREAIASAQKGLLVFDTNTNSFWFHNGIAWSQLINNGSSNWTPTNSNTNLFSSYNNFTLGGGTNIGALTSGVGNDGTLRIYSPLSVNNPSYLNLDATNIQARRQNVFTGQKTEVDLKLNPFGGNVGIGTTMPTAKLQITGSSYSSLFDFGANEDTYIRGGIYGSKVFINDTGNGAIQLGGTISNVGINVAPAVGLDINGAVAHRSITYTLSANVSYESFSTSNTSYIILIANQSTTGIHLSNGNVVGQQLIIQLKTNISSIFFPLTIADNATLTNINLNGNKVMFNNSLLTLIWDGTDWQEIAYSSND